MPISESSEYTARFNMVMLPAERGMLQALAKRQGLKESDVVRQMIRRDYELAFGNKKPAAPAAKSNSLEAREVKAKRTKK